MSDSLGFLKKQGLRSKQAFREVIREQKWRSRDKEKHLSQEEYNEILLSHKKEGNFTIGHNMDGLEGHYAKRNKSERQILYNITCTWNVKNKTSEHNNNKKNLTDLANKVVVTSGKYWEGHIGIGD